MATINLIDPTGSNLAGNTNYENLFIYVDMTAQRKGNTVFNSDDNSANTQDFKSVNLLGYNKKGDNNIFTTDYTLIYNDDNVYEGFGIESIKIETNASYVPKVEVNFIDIKGMSFFNNPKKSPYSILFDFPPPIFTLKIKGYYGKTLEYKLHMVSHNTSFNADDGNFNIKAEFVGNTFAPLTDILFQNVLLVSKLEGKDSITGSNRKVESLADLVSISKTIKEDIIQKLTTSTDFKDYQDLTEKIKIKGDAFTNQISLDNNTIIVRVYNNRVPLEVSNEPKFDIIRNSFSLQQLNIEDNLDYYIVSTSVKPSIDNLFNQIFSAFDTKDSKTYSDKNESLRISINGITYNVPIKINESITYKDIFYIQITNNIKSAIEEYENQLSPYNESLNSIENEAKEIVLSLLGFEPTIYNIMKIICDDIDKWTNKLIEVYNESNKVINTNQELERQYPNVTKFYPFPDFVDDYKKTLPRTGTLASLPEVKFTDKFINTFVNHKRDVELEKKSKTSTLVDEENVLVWFPTNPLDSSEISGSINQYIGVTTVENIFSILFARLYVYYFFTFNNEQQNGEFRIDARLVNYFFKNEKNTILKSIREKKLLESFKTEISKITSSNSLDIDNLIKSIEQFVKYEKIHTYKNNILSSFGLDDTLELNNTLLFNTVNQVPNINLEDPIWSDNDLINIQYLSNSNYKIIKKLNSADEIGLTLNADNNIIFNDGSEDVTAFVAALKDNEEFNQVIFYSINTNTPRFNVVNINSNRLINNTNNINNIIYDYYINYPTNNNTNEKKLYGLLHIIYVPDLKIINEIIFDKPLLIELSVLTNLYLGALAYAYDTKDQNKIYEVDSNYLDEFDNNLLDSNNKDFIYNIYKNNYNRGFLDNNVDTNFKNYRTIIFNKLSKQKSVLEVYKKYFTDFLKNSNNLTSILKFVNGLLDENNKFKSIYTLNDIDITDISFLQSKVVTINSTTLNYKPFYPITSTLFGNVETTKDKINKLLNNETIYRSIHSFKNDLITEITNEVAKLSDETNSDNNISINTIQEIRIETYYSFKNFVDRWIVSDGSSSDVSISNVFEGISYDGQNGNGGLISAFQFVDRAFNEDEAKNAIIDITILQEFENDYNINMLTVIGKLLNENGFDFYPIQNFIDFTGQEWTPDQVFKPQIEEINRALKSPRFTCMYIGGTSKYLDSDFNSNSTFKNDGILDIEKDAIDFTKSNKAFGFRVKFGDNKQSIFTKISLSTEEVQPTNESLKAMSLILDTGPSNPVPISQNLFTTYEQRSYTCKVTMLGDAMIQPTQYFMLENIPMFAGLYLITKVNHSIAGETNSMTTDFEGVRLPKEPRPFVTKPYDVYAKSFLDISTIDPVFETSSRGNTSSGSNLEKKNRTIYLVAGHSFSKEINEPGAVYKIPGTNEYKEEREFTRELRNLIKNRLDSKSIKNEIDDDSLALKYIIPDLRSKVTEDDIVIDIHFNSQENPDQTTGNFASGTEVIIKDRKNDEIIKIGKAIASTINNVLNVGLRHIEGTTTPQELDRRLGIFDLNAKVFLIEVCFLSNPDEYRVYESKKEELAISLAILISELSITENDKTLQTIETYTIFNTLRYDNLNNRQNPYIIPLDSESTFKTLIKKFEFTKVYQYNSYTATNLKFAYENNLNLYKDNIIDQINLTSGKYGLDALFLGGILSIESVSFDPLSVSDGDAIGLGQFTFNGAMPEVLGYMIDNKEEITSVITYNYNSFVFTSKKYGDIVNLLFENNPIDRDKFYYNKFRTYLEETKTSNGTPYIRILVNKIFDNPFIMIEMVGIYLRILEKKYVGTVQNKNAAILAFSYNVGIHKLTNKNSEKPYFDHLRDYYNDTTKQEIKNKIVGNVENEGIKYPERLLDEYLIKFIQTLSKDKSKLF